MLRQFQLALIAHAYIHAVNMQLVLVGEIIQCVTVRVSKEQVTRMHTPRCVDDKNSSQLGTS